MNTKHSFSKFYSNVVIYRYVFIVKLLILLISVLCHSYINESIKYTKKSTAMNEQTRSMNDPKGFAIFILMYGTLKSKNVLILIMENITPINALKYEKLNVVLQKHLI